MISYDTIEEAMAARHAARQARIAAAAVADHAPVPVDENTARAMLAVTGHTANGVTISASDSIYSALVAVGHYTPGAFMAAVHAITDTDDDPFGLLWDGIYSAIYVDEIEFADMADWGTEDVQHTYALVIQHGNWDGPAQSGNPMEPGSPEPSKCQCVERTWSIRLTPDATPGALPVTVWRDGGSDEDELGYVFGPQRDSDGDGA